MKSLRYIGLMCLALLTFVGFTACQDDEDQNSTPITVTKIYLEDYKSAVPDREVTFARLGQMIRIEGSGFLGMKKVYINGYDTYFNVAYVTDNSMLISIHSKTPVVDATEEVRDKIRLVKSGAEFTYDFVIRASSPTITSISNTLPKAGETVTVYGANLHETTKVTLPDGTEITDIESDEDGEWYSFVMPTGITAGGSIYSECANGTAATPAYFNESGCMVLDFDGNGSQGFWSWSATGSMINDEDLVDDPANSGRGKCVMIVPERLLAGEGVAFGKSRVSECWTAGNDNESDDWTRMFSKIPATTPVSEVALQFDIYVPEAWVGTGHIQVCLMNNFTYTGIGGDDKGDNKQTAFYIPWIQDGKVVPFQTSGWQTVTIPFSEFCKYAAAIKNDETPTFQTVVDERNAASYKNFGIGFANTDFSYEGVDVISTRFKTKIYLDNWRVVPCASITISDFNDEEAE